MTAVRFNTGLGDIRIELDIKALRKFSGLEHRKGKLVHVIRIYSRWARHVHTC